MNRIRNWLDFLIFMGGSPVMEALLVLLCVVLILLNAGCGHNMLIENETMGFAARVPVGDANYVGVVIGSSKQVVAAVRGGASFESTTSAGGGIFSASGAENKITTFRSNLQFNEGNLNEAFVNPDVPMEVKLKLAEGVVTAAKAPKFPDSIVTTRDAVMQLGAKAVTSNAVSVANLKPTGVDNVVNKTPEVIKAVTDPVTDTVHDLVNPLEGTISSATNVVKEVKEVVHEVNGTMDRAENVVDHVLTRSEKTILILFGSAAIAICVIILTLCLSSIFRKKSKSKKIHIGSHLDDEVIDEDTPAPVEEAPKPVEKELNWFQKLRVGVMKVVMFIVSIISFIPKPARIKALEALKQAWTTHKNRKK